MRTFYFLLFLIPFFYLVRKKFVFNAGIQHRNHTQVFLFLSNVSKFQVLNPTIMNVTRWEDLGQGNFLVDYTECLSHFPALKDHGRGFYQVKGGPDGSHYLLSQHLTCFFTDFLCLKTRSALKISQLTDTEVSYSESISYSCPWILTNFCIEEITFQRRMILLNLQKIFSKGKLTRDVGD